MGKSRKKTEKERYEIKVIYRSFLTNLRGLKVFVSNLAPVVKRYDEVLIEDVDKTLIKALRIVGFSKGKLRKKKSKKVKLKLTETQFGKMLSILKTLPRLTPHNVQLLYRSVFVMLISYFDFLISDLIHYFYQTYPESLTGKELSITLNELRLCNDISEGIEYMVNKEIEKVSYKSLDNQIKYFDSYLRIDCKKHIINWNIINEAVERRNIIVHNDSKINRRYLNNADLSVIPEKKEGLKEGRKIILREDYFKVVFYEVFIAGIILIQCCWRAWKKEDINEADRRLIETMYDALSEEEWKVAERLGLFSKEGEVYNKRNRLYLDINYCQSLKWQNKKDELEKELKKFDVSSLSPIYILALCALKSDREQFYRNIKKAITIDELKKEHLMEWPLFREFREDPEYEKRIKKAFASASRKSKR